MGRLTGKQPLTIKKRLNNAFLLMRRRGLFAKQYTPCCMGCSLEWIGREIERRETSYKGAVYYHAQDAEALSRAMRYQNNQEAGRPCRDDPRTIERRSCLHIRFASLETLDSLPMVEVGKIACECLTAAGVNPEWSGDPEVTIRVPLLQDLSDAPDVAHGVEGAVSSSHGGPST